MTGYVWYWRKGQGYGVPPQKQGEVNFIDDDEEMMDDEEELELPELEVMHEEELTRPDVNDDDGEDPYNPMGVDYEGSEKSEVSPQSRAVDSEEELRRGVYPGRSTDDEEGFDRRRDAEFEPGVETSPEGIAIGHFARAARQREERGEEDLIIVDLLNPRSQSLIRRMTFALYQQGEGEVEDVPTFSNVEDVPSPAWDMLVVTIAAMHRDDFMERYPTLLDRVVDPEIYHTLHLECKTAKRKYDEHYRKKEEQEMPDPRQEPTRPDVTYKNVQEVAREEKKIIQFESNDGLIVNTALQWLNMMTTQQRQRIGEQFTRKQKVKIEEVEDDEVKEPLVPPPEKPSGAEEKEDSSKEEKSSEEKKIFSRNMM